LIALKVTDADFFDYWKESLNRPVLSIDDLSCAQYAASWLDQLAILFDLFLGSVISL
jgi:hypothetical protein